MGYHIDPSLVTTSNDLTGYRIVRTLGLVRGIVVRSRSIFGTLGASLQTLVGGNITLFTDLCEKTRQDAFDLMVEHAAESVGLVGALLILPQLDALLEQRQRLGPARDFVVVDAKVVQRVQCQGIAGVQ